VDKEEKSKQREKKAKNSLSLLPDGNDKKRNRKRIFNVSSM